MKPLVNNLIAALVILFITPTFVFAWCSQCEGDQCCVCPGKEHGLDEDLCVGLYSSCKEACDNNGTIWDPPHYPSHEENDPKEVIVGAAVIEKTKYDLKKHKAGFDQRNMITAKDLDEKQSQ